MATKKADKKGVTFEVGKVYSRVENGITMQCLCVSKSIPKVKSRKPRAILHHFDSGHFDVDDGEQGWSLVEDTPLDV